MKTIRERIREYSEQRKYMKEYMAAQLIVSQNAGSRIEQGPDRMREARIMKFLVKW